jgi:hypothetical protein
MFENDDPRQRGDLIAALTEKGMNAWELNSGGGTMHVIVTLLDYTVDPPINTAQDQALRSELQVAVEAWPFAASLYIATNSLQTECEIGLMGVDGRTDAQVATEDWNPISSLEEAVNAFQRYWYSRDDWLRTYRNVKLLVW